MVQKKIRGCLRNLNLRVGDSCIVVLEASHAVRGLGALDEVEVFLPGFKVFLRATEEIPRPKNKGKRKTHYFCKKNRHTVKM